MNTLNPTMAQYTFPPSKTVPLKFEQKIPFDILTHAYVYLCDQFHALMTREQMRDTIDARLLIWNAREAIVGEKEFQGGTINELYGIVEKAERK